MTHGILLPGGKSAPGRTKSAEEPQAPPGSLAWRVTSVAGSVLAAVGFTDVALLWVPLNLGNPEWEFATVGATLDALPLLTIGLSAVTVAALVRGSRRTVRAMGLAFGLSALLVLAVYGLYVLSSVVAWSGVAPAYRVLLYRAFVKTTVLAVLYFALFGWLARVSSRPEPLKGGARS